MAPQVRARGRRDRQGLRQGPRRLPRRPRDAEGEARLSAAHRDALAELVAAEGLDTLIVGDLVRPGDSGGDAIADIRWLTGFGGSSGLALVGNGTREFFTDFRYAQRLDSEVGDAFEH